MFGATLCKGWVITYNKNGFVYYLSDIQDGGTKFVWSMRRDKSKQYPAHSAACDMAEVIKKMHKSKKLEIRVTQV